MEEADKPKHNWSKSSAARASQKRPYDKEHIRIRRELIAEDPNCRRCGKPGSHADHIIAICLGGETIPKNMTLLCAPCSRSKTAQEGNFIRWHVKPSRAGAPEG